ncbi:MAG: hypothetical protein F6J93_22820 [Oscillatoria sp. SIO1A7]|nr:hypothetical protein [Oscillatoria sp. SIO1A7]
MVGSLLSHVADRKARFRGGLRLVNGDRPSIPLDTTGDRDRAQPDLSQSQKMRSRNSN